MPTGGVILAAAALGAGIWAGGKIYTHVLRPTGCGIAKVATMGKKHCKTPIPIKK